MDQGTNYIVYLSYGNEGILQECAYSLLSLSRLYAAEEWANTEIWIYTDNPSLFTSFKDCPLPLHYRTLDKETIKLWRGTIDFAHRVKIEALRDLVKDKTGNILYVDTDSVYTHRIDKVWEKIQSGRLYMHVMEGIVSDQGNLVLQKLDRHLRKNAVKKVNGKPLHNLAMWNAGVLGFNTAHKHLLDEVLAFTDSQYPLFPKHVVEQFAFSVYFQETAPVLAAASYIVHYWHLKEMRAVLASFFAHFRGCTWSELTTYSQLIQMHVQMQEKASFFHNRGVWAALQKKKWLPLQHNWDELKKQL